MDWVRQLNRLPLRILLMGRDRFDEKVDSDIRVWYNFKFSSPAQNWWRTMLHWYSVLEIWFCAVPCSLNILGYSNRPCTIAYFSCFLCCYLYDISRFKNGLLTCSGAWNRRWKYKRNSLSTRTRWFQVFSNLYVTAKITSATVERCRNHYASKYVECDA